MLSEKAVRIRKDKDTDKLQGDRTSYLFGFGFLMASVAK